MSVTIRSLDGSQSDSLPLSHIKREQRHVANLLRFSTDKPVYNVRHRLSTGQVAEIDEHEELNWTNRTRRQTDTQRHTYRLTNRHTDRQTRRHTDTEPLKLQRLRTNTPLTPTPAGDINLSIQLHTVVQLCDDPSTQPAGPASPHRPASPHTPVSPRTPPASLTLPDINVHTVRDDRSAQAERTQTIVVKLPQIHQESEPQTPTSSHPGLAVTSHTNTQIVMTSHTNNDDVITLRGLLTSRDSSAVTSRPHTCSVMPADLSQHCTTTTAYRYVLNNNNNKSTMPVNYINTIDAVAKTELAAAAAAAARPSDEVFIDDTFLHQLPETATCAEIPTLHVLLPQSTVPSYFRPHDWIGQEISRAFVYSYYNLLPVLGSVRKNKKNRKLKKN